MWKAWGMSIVLVLASAAEGAAQWSAAAFLGNVQTSAAKLRVTSPDDGTDATVTGVELADDSWRSPVYYGFRLTRTLRSVPWLGIEGEFFHLKAISDAGQIVGAEGRVAGQPLAGQVPLGAVLPHFELSHGLNFLLANAVVTVPLGGPGAPRRAALALRGGLGPTLPHVEVELPGRRADAYQWGALGFQAAAGLDVRLAGPLSALVEFKLTHTSQRVDVAGAEVSGGFTSRHIVAGLGWRFSGAAVHRPFMRNRAR